MPRANQVRQDFPEVHFSPSDLEKMEQQLPAFHKLPVVGRQTFLGLFMVQLKQTGLTEQQWARRKRFMLFPKAIKAWFIERNVKRRHRKHFGLKPRLRMVDMIVQRYGKRVRRYAIEEAGGSEKSRDFLKYWQKAIRRVQDGLSEEEEKSLEKDRQRQLDHGLDPAIRLENCKKRLPAHLKKMAECLWTQMGVIGFFVCGWKDGRKVIVNSYDYNHLIAGPGAEKFSKKYGKEVTDVENKFTHFAVARFGEDHVNHPIQDKFHKQNEKIPPKLKFEDRYPIVGPPSSWSTDIDDSIDTVRAIFSWHYRTGGCKSRKFPWAAIKRNISKYIPSKYLPTNFRLKEASKQGKDGILLLLHHWRSRYKKYGAAEMFRFTHVPGPRDQPEAVDYELGLEHGFGDSYMEDEEMENEIIEAAGESSSEEEEEDEPEERSTADEDEPEDKRAVDENESDDEEAVAGWLSQIDEEEQPVKGPKAVKKRPRTDSRSSEEQSRTGRGKGKEPRTEEVESDEEMEEPHGQGKRKAKDTGSYDTPSSGQSHQPSDRLPRQSSSKFPPRKRRRFASDSVMKTTNAVPTPRRATDPIPRASVEEGNTRGKRQPRPRKMDDGTLFKPGPRKK
ncbi:hypothetical protein BDN72DRAFT_864799 [Pluteus cervinus]|uniref:Uncharacterized protein n=1 Tax=Pluteus cervinus TaxID=181527 RepID=A0ACD3A2G6_9AGAR|nr:hypothetical protein BDN72DRAFT_864799 [Pluteus cervinus]